MHSPPFRASRNWKPSSAFSYAPAIARPIIIDSDPGQDDAVAILVALASPEDFEVLAITAVAGNVPLERTVDNTLRLVELADRTDVPVYAGASRPMINELRTAEYVHGVTGIDGADLPPASIKASRGHGVDRIIEIVSEHQAPVTLCTLGPVTNVGMALQRQPDIRDNIELIVMMGGGFFEGGNTTPAAEFNMLVDPHAAHIMFTSGIPIVMMPLDVTHKALTTPARLQRFRDLGTAAGDCVAGMLDFYDRWDIEKYGIEGGPLHDPTVIAYLLAPDMFQGRHVNVEMVTDTGTTHGMTVIDWWGVTDNEPNALVMREIDSDRYYDLLVERIGRL